MLQENIGDKLEGQNNQCRSVTENAHKLTFHEQYEKRKLEYAGHVMRGSSGETHLYILEGKMYGKRPRGRPRRIWMNDITEWIGLKISSEAKRIAEGRKRWKSMVVNLLLEDDK